MATAIALRDLRCRSLRTIADRILLQRKVFLAQDIGLPLGYGYSWYIHGPYSTDLTDVAYQVILEGFDSIEKNSFKPHYAAMISKVNALEDKIEKNGLQIGVVQWYELIASIAYWSQHGYDAKEKIVVKIRETEPQFTGEQLHAAYVVYSDLKKSA